MISKTENGPILLVEDDASDEFMTLRALKTNHVKNEVVVCRDGAEALDYLFETGKYAWQGTAMPELILLDLKLPKLDGLEVLRGIRADERTRFLPLIIMTSSDDELDRTKSYGLGIVTYIRKPVDFRKLLQAVFQSGLHWLLMDAPPTAKRGCLPTACIACIRESLSRTVLASQVTLRRPSESRGRTLVIRLSWSAAALVIWFWTQSLIGERGLSGRAINDRLHTALALGNTYLHAYLVAANVLLIVSSGIVDLLGIGPFWTAMASGIRYWSGCIRSASCAGSSPMRPHGGWPPCLAGSKFLGEDTGLPNICH